MWKRICAIYLKMVRIWLDNDDDNCWFLGRVLKDKHFWSSEYYIRPWVGWLRRNNPSGTSSILYGFICKCHSLSLLSSVLNLLPLRPVARCCNLCFAIQVWHPLESHEIYSILWWCWVSWLPSLCWRTKPEQLCFSFHLLLLHLRNWQGNITILFYLLLCTLCLMFLL